MQLGKEREREREREKERERERERARERERKYVCKYTYITTSHPIMPSQSMSSEYIVSFPLPYKVTPPKNPPYKVTPSPH